MLSSRRLTRPSFPRCPALAVLLLGVSLVFCTPAQSQTTLYIGGGPGFPLGAWGEVTETGWLAAGGVMFGVGSGGLRLGVDLQYGQYNQEQILFENAKTSLFGVTANVNYAFGSPGKLRPYIVGGFGFAGHRFSADEFDAETKTDFSYQLGAGLDIPLGGTSSLFVEGRYYGTGNSVDTQLAAALLGFAFVLGGN